MSPYLRKEGVFTKAFGKTIRIILKRPFIIVFFSILALIYCVVDFINPTSVFLKWGLREGDIFASIALILPIILKIVVSAKGMAVIAAVLLVASFVVGLVFSGYFSAVNNALEGKPKVQGEFSLGFKKYFGRVFGMSFIFLLLSFLFAMFMLVAAIPGIVVTKAAFTDKPGLYITAVLVDIITISVLFFGFMFFRIYMSFWYPATISYGKKAFITGKRTADSFFWGLVRRFLVIDIVFILFQLLFINIGSSLAVFAVKWVFYTFFSAFLVTYVFTMFKAITVMNSKKKIINEDEDE